MADRRLRLFTKEHQVSWPSTEVLRRDKTQKLEWDLKCLRCVHDPQRPGRGSVSVTSASAPDADDARGLHGRSQTPGTSLSPRFRRNDKRVCLFVYQRDGLSGGGLLGAISEYLFSRELYVSDLSLCGADGRLDRSALVRMLARSGGEGDPNSAPRRAPRWKLHIDFIPRWL